MDFVCEHGRFHPRANLIELTHVIEAGARRKSRRNFLTYFGGNPGEPSFNFLQLFSESGPEADNRSTE